MVEMKEKDLRESIRFFLCKCCMAFPEAILTEESEWFLKCGECGKICATINEKYTMSKELFIY